MKKLLFPLIFLSTYAFSQVTTDPVFPVADLSLIHIYNNNASSKALYQNVYNQAGYTANILTAVEETGFTNAQYWSDIYLEDASFFRMDNISIGYNFDKIFSDQLNGRVSFTVQNAFVITDYSGLDPEISSGSKLGPNVGIDNSIYPRPRTYMLGVNLNF